MPNKTYLNQVQHIQNKLLIMILNYAPFQNSKILLFNPSIQNLFVSQITVKLNLSKKLYKTHIIRIQSNLMSNLVFLLGFLIQIPLKYLLSLKKPKINTQLFSIKMVSNNGIKLKIIELLFSTIKMLCQILLEMFVVYFIKTQQFPKNKEQKILIVVYHLKINLMIWFLFVLLQNIDVLHKPENSLKLFGKGVIIFIKKILHQNSQSQSHLLKMTLTLQELFYVQLNQML